MGRSRRNRRLTPSDAPERIDLQIHIKEAPAKLSLPRAVTKRGCGSLGSSDGSTLGGTPSEWACYRFAKKLRAHKPLLDACLDRVASSLRSELPDLGTDVASDASDMPAYANGQRYVRDGGAERERFSDPDATWGHRSAVSVRKGGGYYGFKLHAAVCTRTGLPLAWEVRTAKDTEAMAVPSLLDAVKARGFAPGTMSADKGYDYGPVHEACQGRGVAPIIARRRFKNEGAWTEHPTCEHGAWTFAGADFKRKATKWRCPSGECKPASKWVKADRRNPLVPRSSKRFGDLYRGRAAVEREFGRLKNEYGLSPLRVRGIERVALHADLTMLARLSVALARARAVTLAA
jgi:transposase, IS5 family